MADGDSARGGTARGAGAILNGTAAIEVSATGETILDSADTELAVSEDGEEVGTTTTTIGEQIGTCHIDK